MTLDSNRVSALPSERAGALERAHILAERAVRENWKATGYVRYAVELARALLAAEAENAALRKACERIAELTDGPAYPPVLGHAIVLARAALATTPNGEAKEGT